MKIFLFQQNSLCAKLTNKYKLKHTNEAVVGKLERARKDAGNSSIEVLSLELKFLDKACKFFRKRTILSKRNTKYNNISGAGLGNE